ncbi:MAG TPA: YqcC family protein [Chitinophagaceae bacterium]|nr:YqcC family protein [Chitinophagaceae bacterium]
MPDTLIIKTTELEEELKRTGLWQKDTPAWVQEYDASTGMTQTGFAQWLQFVFVPNHLQQQKMIPAGERKFLVPQAKKHFSDDVQKGKLLRILIEIDSLL